MFGTHCDTAGCCNRPTHRAIRTFGVKHGTCVEIRTTDRELCSAPGCLEHEDELMYQPETIGGKIGHLEDFKDE